MKSFMLYTLKIIVIFLGVSCIYFSFSENTIKVSQKEIQSNIDNYIFKHGGSAKVKNFTIKELKVEYYQNALIVDTLVDFEALTLKISNQKLIAQVIPSAESNKVFIKIVDFESSFLSSEEFKSQVGNSVNNTIDKITGKIGFTLKEKATDKINKVINIDNEKVREFILNSLQKHNIKVYQLKSPFLSIISLDIYPDRKSFFVEIKYKTSAWVIFFGIVLILLGFLREIAVLMINFYQRFLSPHKGYCCARNHYEGGGSCSQRTKEAFLAGGFIAGITEFFSTTKKCKEVNEENKNKGNDSCDCNPNVGFCSGVELSSGELTNACNVGSGACDIGSCDVGACEVGSCFG